MILLLGVHAAIEVAGAIPCGGTAPHRALPGDVEDLQ
jgi:hypothetical protein